MRCCRELWFRLQTWFGSCFSVAVARLAATAWELLYAEPVALLKKKEQTKRKQLYLKVKKCKAKLRSGATGKWMNVE